MKIRKATVLLTIFALIVCMFAGCQGELGSALRLEEQPTINVEESAKIYPSQVGDVLVDAKVDVPAIDEFMSEYNASADSYTQINYDAIRYNSEQGYYYVNDTESSRGIKFKLDASNNIISASVYSGNINDSQTSLVDMVAIAAQTIGYRNVMSTADKSRLDSIISSYNSSQGAISSSASMFGDMEYTVELDNLYVAIDLPAMPESYNDEDVSSANQGANDTVNQEREDNASNPALNNGSGLNIGDDYQDQYQSNINEKLGGLAAQEDTTSDETTTTSSE